MIIQQPDSGKLGHIRGDWKRAVNRDLLVPRATLGIAMTSQQQPGRALTRAATLLDGLAHPPVGTYRRSVRQRRRGWMLAALITCVTAFLPSCASGSSAPQLLTKPSPIHQSRGRPPTRHTGSEWNPGSDWKLTWSDDFTGTDSLRDWNLSKGSGWGNRELQDYSQENVAIGPGGGLIITASKDGHGSRCWYGACDYSSGQLDTLGKFQQVYGIFAARIKFPAGHGLWPAFWLGSVNPGFYGEIDVIETSNKKPDLVSGFAHSSDVNAGAYFRLPAPLSAGYHIYAVEWTPNSLSWLVDGRTYGRTTIPPGAPFDQPFYLILDLAVGGIWPGPPNATTVFPAHMYVSWVHVYSHK